MINDWININPGTGKIKGLRYSNKLSNPYSNIEIGK
jgi:hypothetical protein